MPPRSDERFDFLRDPELYDLLGRMARKRFPGDEATAEDVRQKALVVAMSLVLEGKGPRPGNERGWTCCVLRNRAKKEWDKRETQEPLLDRADEPDIPVPDQVTLLQDQLEYERRMEIAEDLSVKHPEKVAELSIADGRKDGSGAKQAAARQRKSRARVSLSQLFTAASTAVSIVLAFLLLRRPPMPVPVDHRPPGWTDGTLAAAARELATRSCAAQRWEECITDLDRVKKLDPAQGDAAMAAARKGAVTSLRAEGLTACGQQRWETCVDRLEAVQRYDEQSARDARVQLALSEARWNLRGSAPGAPGRRVDPDAKWGPAP